ncbi:MAG: hypothetical protein ACE14M_03415 [Terriglobales bacterium]
MPMFRTVSKLALLLLICVVALAAGAQKLPVNQEPASTPSKVVFPAIPPNELVREVVNNELHARDEGSFMYRDRRQTPKGSNTKEMIDTKDGVVARLLLLNDQPLTPEQRRADDERLENLLTHPDLQAKKKKEQQQDEERVRKMFRELPNAFIYEYDGIEAGPWGETVRLKFRPNPRFDPPSRETSVFKAMDGKLWVDFKDKRLVKIEATLFRGVNFGWGILGHLDKGGHFFVSQSKVGPERWEATDMNIQFTGKALLFKTIDLRQVEHLSDFRRVPDGLTLAQGIEMLKKNHNVLAENAERKSGK